MIKLDSNENQLEHDLDITNIIKNIDVRNYPDVAITKLRDKIAKKYNVTIDEVFCSNGSDTLIKIITFCLVSIKEEVLIPAVAFPTYEIAAKMKECEYKLIPLKNYGIDLDATLEAITDKTKLIWISNPHNPTGTLLFKEEIEAFLDKVPEHIYVVLDEAYIEFISGDVPDGVDIYKKYKNLILLRTFSKAYGLAGARIGYGFAREDIYKKLALGLGPFDTNAYAQELAFHVIDCDSYVLRARKNTYKEILKYENMCKDLNLEFIKSYAPFIMIKLNDKTDTCCSYLLEKGIVIKNGSKIGMPGWIRISIGSCEQNSRTIEALYEALRKI